MNERTYLFFSPFFMGKLIGFLNRTKFWLEYKFSSILKSSFYPVFFCIFIKKTLYSHILSPNPLSDNYYYKNVLKQSDDFENGNKDN